MRLTKHCTRPLTAASLAVASVRSPQVRVNAVVRRLQTLIVPLAHMSIRPYYVYELVDPSSGEVFYVGKGVGDRANAHELEARNSSVETEKVERIRHIRSESKDSIVRVIGRYESEAEAYAVEATLIHWVYGLTNLTNVQGGKGGRHVRTFGDHGEIEGIDIPKPERSADGVYSAAMRKAREEHKIVDFLKEVTDWLSEETGLPFSEIDQSESNKTKVYVYFEDVRIRLGAFHSSQPTVWLAIEPASKESATAFEDFSKHIGWNLTQAKNLARPDEKYRGGRNLDLLKEQILTLAARLEQNGKRVIE